MGGLDPSGGAGIGRDAAALASIGATPLLVATALTVQTSAGVSLVEPVDASVVAAALEAALGSGAQAVKLGMLHRPEIAEGIAEVLASTGLPVVLDPVLAASSGGRLAADDLPQGLRALHPVVSLVTPNLAEARALLGDDALLARDAAAALVESGWKAALVTGGDAGGAEALDELATADRAVTLVAPRIGGASPRGTGCAFASFVAAGLAIGNDLEFACRVAKGRLGALIAASAEGMLGVVAPAVWPHAGHPFE